MEALNSASLGAMGSLLRKLDKLVHAEPWVPNIRELRQDVGTISTDLLKLSEVHDPPLTVNYWMKEARELSYDMEDCVDQFIQAESETKMDRIGEISGFRTRVEEMMERYHRFNLQYVLSLPTATNTVARHRTGMVDVPNPPVAPVGMEAPKNELLRQLKPDGDDDENKVQLKVVSILGVEGVGKSTLAKELWCILGEEFQCQAFVQSSKKPDMRMILRSILLQVRPNQQPEACQVPNLINAISEHLQDKRYFIIIDDLWTISVWDAVNRAFPENSCGRILTTTTIEDVALACCGYDSEHIFNMKSLSPDHSKELLIRILSGSGKGFPQQFDDAVLDEVARNCGGLPLAITCIATLLASQRDIVHNLEYVQKFLGHNLRRNPASVEILKQVLNLCYNSLPHCLKTCLLYLAVYPENYLIQKEDLMKQWIAEDFICATEEKDVVEVASSYFDDLVRFGLIQRRDIYCIKEGRSYVVHPMVFDFITCKSMEENFITIIDYSQSTIALTEKIRRLSLHFGSATYATAPASTGQWIRSFSFMGLLNCMPSLMDFMLVRVIILHVLIDNGDTSFALREIRGLLLLRYLHVRCNVSVELPDQIGCRKHLETLEIHARVAAVPSDIFHLPRLRHLRLGRKRYLYRKQLSQLILNILPSSKSLSLDDLSKTSSHPVPIFEFPSMIPRSPRWIAHFRNLCYLDVAVRELQTYDVDALAELWALTVLSLYVRSPTAADIHIKRGAFPALKYFRYTCDVMLLTFEKEAMPNLWRLNIGFNAHKGGKYGHVLTGIEHLLKLQQVSARIGATFGAVESDRKAAESAFLDAISKHPCLSSFKVKRSFVRLDGEYDPLEKRKRVQEIEVINEREEFLNKQHEVHEEDLSNDQPGVLEKIPGEDMKKQHADTSDEQQQIEAQNKARSYVLLLATLAATVTYQAGMKAPDRISPDHHRRYKVFMYCNSLAFVASLVVIFLLQNWGWLKLSALKVAMILDLFGLMGAYAAGSCREVSTFNYYVIALVGSIIFYVVTLLALLRLDHKDISRRGNDEVITFSEAHELMEKRRNLLFLLTILAATITYLVGLNTPSGSWLQNDEYRHKTTFYLNSLCFVLSIISLVILLVVPDLYRPAIRSNMLYCVCATAGTFSIIFAFATGKKSTYTFLLMLGSSVLFHVWVSKEVQTDNNIEKCITSDPTDPEIEEGNRKKWTFLPTKKERKKWTFKEKQLVLLATMAAATVTYQAPLAAPREVMHDNWSSWYLAFLCGNSISFVASIAIISVLMLQSLQDKKWNHRVISTMTVLHLLGLLVAYAASTCRSWKAASYGFTLIIALMACFAIYVMLSFFGRGCKMLAAASSASQAKEEENHGHQSSL